MIQTPPPASPDFYTYHRVASRIARAPRPIYSPNMRQQIVSARSRKGSPISLVSRNLLCDLLSLKCRLQFQSPPSFMFYGTFTLSLYFSLLSLADLTGSVASALAASETSRCFVLEDSSLALGTPPCESLSSFTCGVPMPRSASVVREAERPARFSINSISLCPEGHMFPKTLS